MSVRFSYTRPGLAPESVVFEKAVPEGDGEPCGEEGLRLLSQHQLREDAAAAIRAAAMSITAGGDDPVPALRYMIARIRASPVAETAMSRELVADLEASVRYCNSRGGARAGGAATMFDSSTRHASMRVTGATPSPLYHTPSSARAVATATAAVAN